MNALKISEKDYELYKEYKRTKNEDYILRFYEKFSKDICNVIYYRINNKFYSIPLEKDDLMYVIWKVVKDCFETYDEKLKTDFSNFILYKTYQSVIREIRKFLTNGEKIMNDVLSYDECVARNRNFEAQTDNIVFINKPYQETYKEISNFILENIVKLDKNDVKKVIYLKSLGYSNVEIEKKLNFKRCYVRRIIEVIKKIGEKY